MSYQVGFVAIVCFKRPDWQLILLGLQSSTTGPLHALVGQLVTQYTNSSNGTFGHNAQTRFVQLQPRKIDLRKRNTRCYRSDTLISERIILINVKTTPRDVWRIVDLLRKLDMKAQRNRCTSMAALVPRTFHGFSVWHVIPSHPLHLTHLKLSGHASSYLN